MNGWNHLLNSIWIMGRNQQNKGRRGERELSRKLNELGFNTSPADPLNFGKIPDVIGLPDIHIECKRTEKLRLSEAMKQAIQDADKFKDGLPCVFHRKNREQWLVTMPLKDWANLYKKGTDTK